MGSYIFFLFWSLVFLFKLILIVLKCSSKFHYNSLFFFCGGYVGVERRLNGEGGWMQ